MNDATILIGTDDGLHRIGNDTEVLLRGHAIHHVAASPEGMWVILDGDTLAELNPDGERLRTVQLTSEQANCVLPTRSGVWVGASRASLWKLADGRLGRVTPFDHAPGRQDWHTPWRGPPDVRSMAEDQDGSLYVNVHVGGVVRSTDGGGGWSDTVDIDADVHQIIADPVLPGHAYAATARGLAVTSDGAGRWDFTTEGLHAPYCRAVTRSASALFVSASAGPRGSRAALYRRRREGGRLEKCTGGLPEWFSTNLDTHCLAARNRLVVAGDADGTMYVSTDEGDSWEVEASGLPHIRSVILTGPP